MTNGLDYPIPDFAGMSGDSLRNWLRRTGSGIFTDFDTVERGLNWFRAQGGHIRTSDFYDIARSIRNVGEYSDRLGVLGENDLVPMAWTQPGMFAEMYENYLYVFKVEGFDAQGNLLEDKWLGVASDNQMTLGQAMDTAYTWQDADGMIYGMSITSLTLEQAYRRRQ